MLIHSLEKMEAIVRKNRNLIWDGYDVIILDKHHNPVVAKNAKFVKGKWWRTRTVPLTKQGWVLPDDVRKA